MLSASIDVAVPERWIVPDAEWNHPETSLPVILALAVFTESRVWRGR